MATTQPNHAAQMQHLPLIICGALDGYAIAYQDGAILHDEVAVFTRSSVAFYLQREAEGATAAILAKVFGGRA